MIVADDLGTDRLCRYRADCHPAGRLPEGVAHTPRLDALIDEGVLFENAWSNPVCSTTRATVLTGQYSRRNGILAALGPTSPEGIENEDWTLPEMLRDLHLAGEIVEYDTAAFGKWHLNAETRQDPPGLAAPLVLGGFDYFEGTPGNLTRSHPDETYCDYLWLRVSDDAGTPRVQEGFPPVYATSWTVDRALAWLEDRPEPDKPWLMYVAFHAPHTPLHEVVRTPGAPGEPTTFGCGLPCSDPDETVRNVDCYLQMVEAMDTEIGRLLDELAAAPTDFPTVFFLGDNGAEAGVLDTSIYPEIPNDVEPELPLRHAKTTVFEGGVRVPLLVSGGAVTTSGAATALVQTSDLLKTVADLLQVASSPVFEGRELDSTSFMPLLSDLGACANRGVSCRPSAYAEIRSAGNDAPCDDPPFCTDVRQAADALAYRSTTHPGFKLVRGCLRCTAPDPGTSMTKACAVTDCAEGNCLYDLSLDRTEVDDRSLDEPQVAAELAAELDDLLREGLGQCLDPRGCPVACP